MQRFKCSAMFFIVKIAFNVSVQGITILIITEYNAPYIISQLNAPIVPKFNWIFSGEIQDFKLSQISYLEETTGPAIEVMINKYKFTIPASWQILIADQETMLVDTVPISNCSSAMHQALLMCPTTMSLYTDEVKIIDYVPESVQHHVSIAKGSMLCHPVGPVFDHKPEEVYCCMIGPHDIYKYIQGMTAKELIL